MDRCGGAELTPVRESRWRLSDLLHRWRAGNEGCVAASPAGGAGRHRRGHPALAGSVLTSTCRGTARHRQPSHQTGGCALLCLQAPLLPKSPPRLHTGTLIQALTEECFAALLSCANRFSLKFMLREWNVLVTQRTWLAVDAHSTPSHPFSNK